ncbi:MAG: outer membrane lipid asymmetry maintenance protein MlaD [Alphaproteobacteria bacterium CG_4_10_14_0_8_um_filter_37_21]|nr:MAG: outer membrane lipid asymmetry maintenance protein MlaD [Alphaproteobacteria bacterium CG_4_10_14_0_8_um_filter_37_21]
MKNNFFETVIGFFVLSVAGIFLYFAYSATASNSGSMYQLNAKFDRIDGLSVGNDVKLSGVKVGAISNIDVDPKTYRALVTFTIRNTIQLPIDSSADIVSDGLLGGKYIHLAPGAESDMLQDNEYLEFTQSAVNLEALISKFMFSSNSDKTENVKETKTVTIETEAQPLSDDVKETKTVTLEADTQPLSEEDEV